MATLYEYYNIGDNAGWAAYGAVWQAQTFTPTTAHKITSVKLKLYRLGSPGTVTVGIRATDASGHPAGADLCSGTTDGNTLPTGSPYEWREITLGDGYNLTPNIKYAIVVRATAMYVGWRKANTGTYAEGCVERSTNSGSTWTSWTAQDFMFEDWGEAIAAAYYHGLKVQGEGELALCDVGSHPLRIRKGGTTYGIELVAVDDPNASRIRLKTSAGTKAIRKYT